MQNNLINAVLLSLYPVMSILILCSHMKISSKGEFVENCFDKFYSKQILGIAAISVMLHHLSQFVTNNGHEWKGLITLYYDAGVLFTSLFFFFSGYGLMISLDEKDNYLKGFLYNRLSKILIPFFITNIMYTIVNHHVQITAKDLIKNILGLNTINNNSWFLIDLVILYIIFYMIFRLADKESGILMIFFIVLMMIGSMIFFLYFADSIQMTWFKGEWWYNTILIFPFGLFVGHNRERIVTVIKNSYNNHLSMSSVLFFGFYSLRILIYNDINNGLLKILLTLAINILLCGTFVSLVLLIMMKIKFRNRVLTFLGSMSFEIYLIHDLFLSKYKNMTNRPADYIVCGIVLSGSLLLAYLLKIIDDKIIDFVTADTVITKNRYWS